MLIEDCLVLDYMVMLCYLNIDFCFRFIMKFMESIYVDQFINKWNDYEWKDLFGVWSNIDDSVEE